MRTIPKSTSDWLVKEFKNREQKFFIYKIIYKIKFIYIIALLFHIVTIQIHALII